MRKSPYFDAIRQSLARQGYIGTDPRQVEAYMRLEHPTLDGLSAGQFESEVSIGAQACAYDPDGSEALAQSFGL